MLEPLSVNGLAEYVKLCIIRSLPPGSNVATVAPLASYTEARTLFMPYGVAVSVAVSVTVNVCVIVGVFEDVGV